ncbi:AMP-binding protein [Saccharopolyspora sp. NPDC050389]|uniref:class I adenylate-forming enzyme family protein n=1 Tax=Saccharopolyspora sp. NPDC050389 TaxID=3155516 RepID=UPI0033D098A1
MTTLAELVAAAHRTFAARPAVGALTFGELGAQARAAATALRRLGLRPGDRVLIALDNRPEVLALEHALWLGGFVRVAVSTRLHPAEIAAIADDCGAAAIVTELDVPGRRVIAPGADLFTGPADDFEPRRDPDELVALMYTSGSTGRPKGAQVTSGAWVAMVEAMWQELPPIGPDDVVLHVAPMSHFSGSVGSAYTLAGAAAVPLTRFDPVEALAAIDRHRVTAVTLVPTMLERLAEVVDRPTSLRAVVYGAAPISVPAMRRAQRALGTVLYQFYGLSEALAPLTVLSAADHAAGQVLSSIGRPVDSVELSILDGEIAVRGPQIMPGYWGGEPLWDGWFRTGDLGRVDDAGYVHLAGRRSELIVTGGFNVYPAEVEQAIAALDGVAEVAVLGVPDARWGEAVSAAVVRRPGAEVSEEDVRRACAQRLAGYKKPRRVVFLPELPQISIGKPDRKRLRAAFS